MTNLPVYLTVTDTNQQKTLTIEGHLELLWRVLPSLAPDWQDRTRVIELQPTPLKANVQPA